MRAGSSGADVFAEYIDKQQRLFAEQERDVSCARKDCVDSRVDVVLYFLPTNARVAEVDVAAMHALAKVAPVVPIMPKVSDCLSVMPCTLIYLHATHLSVPNCS